MWTRDQRKIVRRLCNPRSMTGNLPPPSEFVKFPYLMLLDKRIGPTIFGTAAFAMTLSISTLTQLKILGVSTGTLAPIPTFLGMASVAVASLASHRTSIEAYKMIIEGGYGRDDNHQLVNISDISIEATSHLASNLKSLFLPLQKPSKILANVLDYRDSFEWKNNICLPHILRVWALLV